MIKAVSTFAKMPSKNRRARPRYSIAFYQNDKFGEFFEVIPFLTGMS
jgi:hypothetical protein